MLHPLLDIRGPLHRAADMDKRHACRFGTRIPKTGLEWLVGFVVLREPAGAGLREAALAMANDERFVSQSTLAAIIPFRRAPIGTDFLASTASYMPGPRDRVPAQASFGLSGPLQDQDKPRNGPT